MAVNNLSYTKFSKEINKWLKDNNLPQHGKSSDTPEEKEKRLSAWKRGTKHIFNKWLSEKRYKELISCAHGGWYEESEFFLPLADFFVKEQELECLKILYERKIRFEIEDMMKLVKYEKNDGIIITSDMVQKSDIGNSESEISAEEIAKCRQRALDRLGNYIRYLERINMDSDYLEAVKIIKNKVIDLTVRKSDLKYIKNKFL